MKHLLAIAALAGLLMGPTCGGTATVAVGFSATALSVPPSSVVNVDVVLNSSADIQAWEIDLASDFGLVILDVLPHSQFDDDGAFFRAPTVDWLNGLAQGAADLRHGAPVTGQVSIATVKLLATAPGTYKLRLTRADLAKPNGNRPSVNTFALELTVTP